MAVNMDQFRNLEPISKVLRALAIPPPETVIPTPKEILNELGIITLEEMLPPIKQKIQNKVVKDLRKLSARVK